MNIIAQINPVQSAPITEGAVIAIAGTIILILLSVVGYFIQNNIKLTKNIQDTVVELKSLISLIQEKQMNDKDNLNDFKNITATRLNDHSKRLNEHDRELERLKVIHEKE